MIESIIYNYVYKLYKIITKTNNGKVVLIKSLAIQAMLIALYCEKQLSKCQTNYQASLMNFLNSLESRHYSLCNSLFDF